MTTPTTVLITGATQGLGAETAAQLAGRGCTVWLGARDVAAGEAVAGAIRASTHDADLHVVRLDVTSDDSVAAAYDEVSDAGGGLDVLVNNAGVSGDPVPPVDTTPGDFLAVFGVNLLGPVRVTHAFLPLLRASERPRLVMVSSSLGSVTAVSQRAAEQATAWGMVYPSSKAALNMVTLMYAMSLPDVRVTAVAPGFTATNLNDFAGHQTVHQGAEPIVEACLAEELPGVLLDRNGALAW